MLINHYDDHSENNNKVISILTLHVADNTTFVRISKYGDRQGQTLQNTAACM